MKAPTEKQLAARKKFGEAAKARAAAKKAQKEEPILPIGPREDTISHDEYDELLRQIAELKKDHWSASQDNRVSLQGGRLIGTVEKYDLTPNHYPDETTRLSKESFLERVAFDANYELKFGVSVSEYTTLDGIRTKEPKFTLELIGKIFDEETHELTTGRYIIRRLIMHEDPEAALVIAREQNLDVDEDNEEAFLNEMRYIRMRDWLLECYYPTAPKNNNRKREMVVEGKIVEYFEVTTEDTETARVPFGELVKHKL